ncbi:MAG: proton-translocating NADH-quinone oxidoreductase subunit L, partial [Kribbellaceae bacterium]|nr:proton-translocating NADH-quinone oxidoreductase subunit L [Kribbellaceae bacterium]
MIATAWRVVGVGFSLLVVLAAALLHGVSPRTTAAGGAMIGQDFWFSYEFRTDGLTVLMLAVVGVVSACVQVYSIGYVRERVASYTA